MDISDIKAAGDLTQPLRVKRVKTVLSLDGEIRQRVETHLKKKNAKLSHLVDNLLNLWLANQDRPGKK